MLEALAAKLPARFQFAAKTVAAGVGACGLAAVHGLISGHWDTAALEAGAGTIVAGLVFATPNRS